MQTGHTNLLTRDDTFFGVCQGLGEDLGIHPNILRLSLTLLLFFNPMAAAATYVGAGVLVAFTRWLVPNPRIEAVETSVDAPAEQEACAQDESAEPDPIPLAA